LYIVGITGGIGSGKTEAAKLFAELSVPVIDLDDIAHQITHKDHLGYIGIKKYFGNKYLNKNNEINRKKLKIDFFKSIKIKEKIESILHPIIFDECKKQINKYKSEEYIVIVIALLFETQSYLKLINESLFIDCDEKIQIKRVTSRDKLDENLIKSIIKSQLPRKEKIEKADIIIDNNGTLNQFKNKIYEYHKEINNRVMENKR
jgi:dephospho-CoA kinase